MVPISSGAGATLRLALSGQVRQVMVSMRLLAWLRALKRVRVSSIDFSAGSGVWLIADRLVRMVTGLLAGALVARYLGPEGYGRLAYSLAVVVVLQTASILGLDLVLASELPRPLSDPRKLLGSSLVLRLVAGVVLWGGCVVAAFTMGAANGAEARLVVLVGLAILVQPVDLIDLLFQSKGLIRIAAIPRMAAALLVAILRVTLVLGGAPLEVFALTYAGEFVLVLVIMITSSRAIRSQLEWRPELSCAGMLLVKAWPLLLSSLATILYMRIDQIMLGSMASPSELGRYAAVLPFSQAWNVIPTALVISATPGLVRSLEAGRESLDRDSLALFRRMFIGAMVVSVVTAALAVPMVGLLLGGKYAGGAAVLAAHAFTNIPVFLGVAQTRYLSIIGDNKVILVQTLAGVVASVLANFMLIPILGALGAALSAIIAMLISAVGVNAIFSRHLFRIQLQAIGIVGFSSPRSAS